MRRVDGLGIVALLVALVATLIGLLSVSAGPVPLLPLAVVVGLWLFGRIAHRSWPITGAFALLVLLAVYLVFEDGDPLLGILAVIAALIWADLDAFRQRLSHVDRVQDEGRLIGRHLLRLGLLSALSLLLYGATTVIRLDLGVWTAMLLSLLLFIGLARAITYLRRESS